MQLPEDYLVIDCETTGFSPADDLITQVGWAIVCGRRVVWADDLVLNWAAEGYFPAEYIQEKLRWVADKLAQEGKRYQITWERMQAEGVPPREGLEAFLTLQREHCQLGGWLVGHGLLSFERRMLTAALERYFPGRLLGWGNVWDTGLTEKAVQLEMWPWPGETAGEWFERIEHTYAAVKWNLDTHCWHKYGLASRTQYQPDELHDARRDCLVVHCLLEQLRERYGGQL